MKQFPNKIRMFGPGRENILNGHAGGLATPGLDEPIKEIGMSLSTEKHQTYGGEGMPAVVYTSCLKKKDTGGEVLPTG